MTTDPVDGSSFRVAVCLTAFLFGALVVGLPEWVTDGIVATSGIGLIYAGRAWFRAVRRP